VHPVLRGVFENESVDFSTIDSLLDLALDRVRQIYGLGTIFCEELLENCFCFTTGQNLRLLFNGYIKLLMFENFIILTELPTLSILSACPNLKRFV
jgi:hypothetical protein